MFYATGPRNEIQKLHLTSIFQADPRSPEADLTRFGQEVRQQLFCSVMVTNIGNADRLDRENLRKVMARTTLLKAELVVLVLPEKSFSPKSFTSNIKTVVIIGKL